jgi:hypothetical protein
MPLDFLLEIMRDENQDARSRLDAAKAAAPDCHARLSSTEVSGPSGSPVEVQTTNVLDVSHITDMAELEALERGIAENNCEDGRGAVRSNLRNDCTQRPGR